MENNDFRKKILWLAIAAWLLCVGAFCVIASVIREKNENARRAAYEQLAQEASTEGAGSAAEVSEGADDRTTGGLSPEGLMEAAAQGENSENASEQGSDEISDDGDASDIPEAPVRELDWDKLHQTNPDIYAWIYVPGTCVDYPVLQHPSNNEYYLNHNLDGSYGFPGVIYTENYNSRDFTDPNTVIYGHNMDNDTMFSTLHNFADPQMVEEPHYIYIYTEDGRELVYEIFAAYEYVSIHLLLNFDVSNEYVFAQYIRNIENMDSTSPYPANIRHDIEPDVDDRLITLSTCTVNHDASKRFLVVGVLLNP
ncbi:MAG: class B sortase [Lachnospiraceae bacterium]|nr:class B sortase [Lachnospiraceae bacterium]